MGADKKNPVVLVVDDVATNRQYLAMLLKNERGYTVKMAADGRTVLDEIDTILPDIILLDIMMPGISGYEVARLLKRREKTKDIPILFITAVTEQEGLLRGFESGGVDYITKPFNKHELLARVEAHIRIKTMQDELFHKNEILADREQHLRELVEEKTRKLEGTAMALVTALESANLFNDEDTGSHIRRVREYSGLLADLLGLDEDFSKRIRLYASLHDVGKVGIPDSILKKPGRYTQEEWKLMADHVDIGGRMLDSPEIDPMARNIALYHHEKWDGTGYNAGLAGEDIPLEARIVALADVYDALGSARVYKPAFGEEKIQGILHEERGRQFQPELVDLYFSNVRSFLQIKNGI